MFGTQFRSSNIISRKHRSPPSLGEAAFARPDSVLVHATQIDNRAVAQCGRPGSAHDRGTLTGVRPGRKLGDKRKCQRQSDWARGPPRHHGTGALVQQLQPLRTADCKPDHGRRRARQRLASALIRPETIYARGRLASFWTVANRARRDVPEMIMGKRGLPLRARQALDGLLEKRFISLVGENKHIRAALTFSSFDKIGQGWSRNIKQRPNRRKLGEKEYLERFTLWQYSTHYLC